jgi:hypothetical protein
MKNFLLIITLLLFLVNSGFAQSPVTEYTIVGAGPYNSNLNQVQKRYQQRNNVYYIQESQINPLEQITQAIDGLNIQDLHIFLQSQPNALTFNSTVVTLSNVQQYAESLVQWKNAVSGKVVIHSLVAFTTPDGIELKNQLEQITGLTFITKM